jgi:choline dehydrogenase-like flavoprotein
VLVHGVRLARRIAATPPLAAFIADELAPGADAQTDDAILEHARCPRRCTTRSARAGSAPTTTQSSTRSCASAVSTGFASSTRR